MSQNTVDTRVFSSFKGASGFAVWMAIRFQQDARVEKVEEGFRVNLVESLPFSKLCDDYVFNEYRYRGDTNELRRRLEVFDDRDKEHLSSQAHVWLDSDTGITWDKARLFAGDIYGPRPEHAGVNNLVAYGGYADWRRPTIAELRTLTPAKQQKVDLSGVNAWSGEADPGDRDEYLFLDLATMTVGYQYFIEQHKDHNTRGDGYTKFGKTIFMRCGLKTDVALV